MVVMMPQNPATAKNQKTEPMPMRMTADPKNWAMMKETTHTQVNRTLVAIPLVWKMKKQELLSNVL